MATFTSASSSMAIVSSSAGVSSTLMARYPALTPEIQQKYQSLATRYPLPRLARLLKIPAEYLRKIAKARRGVPDPIILKFVENVVQQDELARVRAFEKELQERERLELWSQLGQVGASMIREKMAEQGFSRKILKVSAVP